MKIDTGKGGVGGGGVTQRFSCQQHYGPNTKKAVRNLPQNGCFRIARVKYIELILWRRNITRRLVYTRGREHLNDLAHTFAHTFD